MPEIKTNTVNQSTAQSTAGASGATGTSSSSLNKNWYWVLMGVFSDQQTTQQKLQESSLQKANSLNEQMKAINSQADKLTEALTDKTTKKSLSSWTLLFGGMILCPIIDLIKNGNLDVTSETFKGLGSKDGWTGWTSEYKVDKSPDEIAKESRIIDNLNRDSQLIQSDYNKEFNVYFQNQSNNEQAAAKLFNGILEGFASVGKTS